MERTDKGRFKSNKAVPQAQTDELDPLSQEMVESLPDAPKTAPKTETLEPVKTAIKPDGIIPPEKKATATDEGVSWGALALFGLGALAFFATAGRIAIGGRR
jgi:hypothetical protein